VVYEIRDFDELQLKIEINNGSVVFMLESLWIYF
jgi:hypothetical protein